MLDTIIIILVVLWLLGWLFGLLGAWIHVLLLVAVVLFIYKLVKDKKKKP